MTNPLVHYDRRNVGHVEPSVSGFVDLEANEPSSADPVNDMVILSPFRSGKPLLLVRHRSLATIESMHDPHGNGDQGVALARVAKRPFSDSDVFGAARIITCRVDPSLNASCRLTNGVSDLIKIERTDYGSHTNGPGVTFGAGTHGGKKIVLIDTINPAYIGDDLGLLLTGLQYTGNGSAASLTIVSGVGKIAYSAQPADGDKLTINGVVFEFDNNSAVTGGNIAVTIGVNQDVTFANLAAAVVANCPGVTTTVDATNNVVTLTALEQGVVMVETLDAGNAVALTHLAPAARLRTTLTSPTDGSQNLDIPLTLSQFRSIDRLASYINSQQGYTCSVSPYANKFLDSAGLDIVTGVNIKVGPVTLTGYVAATVDFINTKTRGDYLATEIARDEPVDQTVVFAGGATKPVTATDWQNALDAVGAALELGGILLLDTDDPAIFAMTATFIREQEQSGKWFRAFMGAEPGKVSGQDISAYDAIASAIDEKRCRLVVQRFGQFRADSRTIDYVHPVYAAAALAGGAAGNLPWVKPLTNKRLPFAGLHPDDSFTLEVREALLLAGITVFKQEADRLVVDLAVTTSRDPDRRMARIMSEVDLADSVDSAVRAAFLSFRGQWANQYIAGRVKGTLKAVLDQFVRQGALVPGTSAEGEFIPAWRYPNDPPFVIHAGGIDLDYQIYVGSEINHVGAYGRATYQRIVGDISGGSVLDRPVSIRD